MSPVVDAPLAHVGQQPKSASIGARRMPVTDSDRLAILAGEKTEIRHMAPGAWVQDATAGRLRPPGPCIVYTERADRLLVTALVWADTPWYEPLTAISPESLKAEGYETYEEWLTYMKHRHAPKTGRVRWGPMAHVRVTRVRRLTDEDIQAFKDSAFERLYGRYA